MSTQPLDRVVTVEDATEAAFRRMLAARDRIRRRHAMAGPYPADAAEVIGIHSPEVMRDARNSRAAR